MTKPPGSLLVRVVNINGKEIYRTWACTVQEVKDDLRVQYGYKLEAQKLMYKAQILRPHTDLAPYGDSVELTLVLQTVLCEAASDGREEVVRKLLSRGAGLDPAGDPCPMIQAMQGAAFYGHEGVARLLLEVARPEDRNLMVTSQSWMEFPGEFADGTPLHTAAHKGHVAMIELLLSVGVPKAEFLQAINRSGQLALHGAAMEKGDERAFCLLLQPVGTRERKRMLSVRDRRERTPLHYAAINGHEVAARSPWSMECSEAAMAAAALPGVAGRRLSMPWSKALSGQQSTPAWPARSGQGLVARASPSLLMASPVGRRLAGLRPCCSVAQRGASAALATGLALAWRRPQTPGRHRGARLVASGPAEIEQPMGPGGRVPIILLTGFLGTGKTTLLKHWLENAEGRRIGVVVNDVASVNIDAKLVNQQLVGQAGSVDTIQLQNGCACCSLGDELLVTIYELLQLAGQGKPFSHIVVELSGVAEPSRVVQNFRNAQASGSEVVEGVEFGRVVTLLDSSTFCTDYMEYRRILERPDLMEDGAGDMMLGEYKVVELLVEQVEAADAVVLNKTDLAAPDQLATTRAVVSALNDKATLHEASFGRVQLEALAGDEDARHTATPVAVEGKGHAHEQRAAAEQPGHGRGGHDHGRGHDCAAGGEAGHGHGHGHSHGHSHEDQTTAEVRFNIRSFTYSARRPFHGERLAEMLQRWPVPRKDCLGEVLENLQKTTEGETMPFSTVIRSKGFCWLEKYPCSRMYWSHAGKSVVIEYEGLWWGSMTEDQSRMMGRLEPGSHQRALDEDWCEEWADRRQELVFIGQDMDEAAIRATLDRCLLTDEEMPVYRQKQVQETEEVQRMWSGSASTSVPAA